MCGGNAGGQSSLQNDLANPVAADGTPEQMQEFANSSAASSFSPAEIAGVSAAHYGTGDANVTASGLDLNPVLTAFNTWIAQQNASNTDQASYSKISNSEQGRDATILTGPQVNPNSILGGGKS